MNARGALALVGVGLLVGAVAGWWARSVPSARPPPSAAAPTSPSGSPHVVLVIGCTVRRDQIGVYGGHPRATPFLDELAATGARFDDAVAAAPWTRAASTALLTGRHPIDLGMIEPGDGPNERALPMTVTTLAEVLQSAGYQTLGTTANPNLNGVFGFAQGFDHYVEVTAPWGQVGMIKVDGAEVVSGLLAAVDTHWDGATPLYLQAMLIDAHEPRHAPMAAIEHLTSPDVPRRVALYRYNLRRFDESVRALVDGLAARGVHDPLLVVVSDHGEGLLHPLHHGRGHGVFTYPSTVAMPWLMRGPGVGRGVVIDGVASQVDVMPTLLGMLQLSRPDDIGRDWSALVEGGGRTDRRVAYVDTWFQGASRVASYDAELACHHDAAPAAGEGLRPPTACYDRRSDPDAMQPIEPIPEAAIDGLLGWRAERVAAFEALGELGVVEIDDALRGQLEALGYAQGEGDDEKELKSPDR